MLKLNVKVDVDKAVKKIANARDDQVPFATAKALTLTAKDCAGDLVAALPDIFDRPTPYTLRAFGTEMARKSNLARGARVFIKPDQLKYLGIQVEGGTRTPAKKALLIPADIGTNQYGNIPRGKIQQMLARADVFSGTVRGVAGIWQRMKRGGVKLLVAYEHQARYKKRFDFYGLVEKSARAAFPGNFRTCMADAMRSAR